MKNYFLPILFLTVINGVCSFLLSGKKCENLFRYLASLCFLLALFSPLKNVFSSDFFFKLPEISGENADYSTYIKGVEQEASKRLTESYSQYICKETGMSENDLSLSIKVSCEDQMFLIEEIQVELYTITAVLHRDKIDNCLKELNIEVVYLEKLTS